jgi:hypothetical protein
MNFETTTGSIDPNKETKLNKDEEIFYFVAFDKMKSVEDLILVMASMGFGISNKHFNYDKIKHLLDHDRPVRGQ